MSVFFPILRYRDAHAAIEFLERAFGFERKAVYEGADGTVDHAELAFGGGVVMLGSVRDSEWSRQAPPPGSGAVYVVVKNDVDAHHDRAKAAGAEIVYGPVDQDYGSRDYAARDPEGNLWSFGTYAPE
jgi:uncharacterized glyoxalase superfamily protein PhnB